MVMYLVKKLTPALPGGSGCTLQAQHCEGADKTDDGQQHCDAIRSFFFLLLVRGLEGTGASQRCGWSTEALGRLTKLHGRFRQRRSGRRSGSLQGLRF